MLRSLKARIELDAQEAIARLEQLGLNMDEVKKQLAQGQIAAQRFGQNAEVASRQAQVGFQKLEDTTLSGVQALEKYRMRLLAVGAAGTAAVGFMVKASMEVETSLMTFNALYEANASATLEWAETWGRAHGYATSTILPFLSQTQAIMLSIGFAREEAAKYSKQVLQLAADVSAVSGTPLADTIDVITRALAGQTRGLANLGILVREDILNAEAQRLGFRKKYDELTELQKATVSLSAIQKAAAYTQGYLTEHMDMASVQTRRLKEELGDLREQMGDPWFKIWGKAAGPIANFIERFKEHKHLVTFISILFGVGSAALTALGQIGMLILAFHQLQNIAIGGRLIHALQHPFTTITSMAQSAYLHLLYTGDRFKEIGSSALNAGKNVMHAGAQMIRAAVQSGAAWVKSLAIKTASWAAEKAHLLIITAQNWLYTASVEGGFVATVKSTAATVAHGVALAAQKVALWATTAAQWALNAAMYANPATWLIAVIMALVAAVGGLAYGIYRLVQHFGGLKAVMHGIGALFIGLWNKMRAFGKQVVAFGQSVAEFFSGLWGHLKILGNKLVGFTRSIGNIFVGLWEGLQKFGNAIAEFGRRIEAFFRGVWKSITAGFRELWNILLRLANNGTRRILAILNSAFGWVPWIGGKIKGAIKDFDPLMPLVWEMRKSQPRLAAEVERIANTVRNARPDLHGADLMQEFANEIARTAPHLQDAVGKFIIPMQAQLETHSPPKAGPLRKIREWGRNLGIEYAKGVEEEYEQLLRRQPVIKARIDYTPSPSTYSAFVASEVPVSLDVSAVKLEEAMNRLRGAVEWMPGRMEGAIGHGMALTQLGAQVPLTLTLGGLPATTLPSPLPSAGTIGTLPTVSLPIETGVQKTRKIQKIREVPGITINLGGVTINMREGASVKEAQNLGKEAATALTGKMKEELSRYLLEMVGAEEALRMPDEVE